MKQKHQVLPYGRHTIEDDDIAAVSVALRSNWLTTGPLVEEFEQAFARTTGAANAVVCNSGTAALHLAAMALDLGPSQAAVVPAMTFLSTANAVRMTGAEVIFADVDGDTGLMTARTFRDALERHRSGGAVTAAFPVHLNGQLCDLPALAAVAEANGITLVEDACHALGVADVGATRHSRMACFSTHPVKAIAMGEGGIVTTADRGAAVRMRRLRSHGMARDAEQFPNHAFAFDGGQPNPWYYEMHEIGWNYRAPDVLCALGLSQLRKLARFTARRRAIAAQYDRMLAPLAPVIRPAPHREPGGWHLYVILVDFSTLGVSRAQFMTALRDQGIGTQVHYIPLHQQPYYRERYGALRLPGAETYYERCLSIPLYPSLTDAEVQRVVGAIAHVAAAATRS